MAAPSTVILVPVLGRPQRVAPLIAAFEAATPEPHRLLFIASTGDRDELDALADAKADVLEVDGRGTYPEKINAGHLATHEPVLFLAADDVTPHPGWLTAGLAKIGRAQVVGTNDLGNARTIDGTHSTHTFVTRDYVNRYGAAWDQRGVVLHEGYRHWYCDDELVGVAKARGVWAHAGDSIVEHHHPFHGTAEMDATYRKGAARKNQDRALFTRRSLLWT